MLLIMGWKMKEPQHHINIIHQAKRALRLALQYREQIRERKDGNLTS